MSLQRARWGKISLSLPFPSDSFYPWPLPTFSMSVGVAYFCAASWFCLVKSYPLPPAVTCCTSSAPSRRQYSLLMLYLEIYDPVSCRLSSCAKLFLGGGDGRDHFEAPCKRFRVSRSQIQVWGYKCLRRLHYLFFHIVNVIPENEIPNKQHNRKGGTLEYCGQ